jgi:DNA repair protein RecN (Recombination protein N)
MLEELDIRDFVIADDLHLRLAPGFNAITGETGAGKSLVIDALGILLGDRPSSDLVRAGAEAARIEASFAIPNAEESLGELLVENGLAAEDGVLLISREIPVSGRSSARINGRAVVQSTLLAIGEKLVDIHSQNEHLAILRPAEHVHYLDRFAGTVRDRVMLGESAVELRRLRADIEKSQVDERERARRQERLAYEISEIEEAGASREEEDELRRERARLANAEQLTQLVAQVHAALEGDGDRIGATETLGRAATLLAQLAQLDEDMRAAATQMEALQSQAADLSRDLRAYGDEVEYRPERLTEVEERLSQLAGLKRKYGATLTDVAAYAEQAARELDQLNAGEERLADFEARAAALAFRVGDQSVALGEARRNAAARLSAAVERELAELGLAGGRFAVQFDLRPDPGGIAVRLDEELVTTERGSHPAPSERSVAVDRTGADRVEFLVSLNIGEPPRPLARVASGGETARLMLALKTILGAADAVPTLVFDEVDSGVGGRSGRIVGAKLAGLAAHHQVICITHLAQIASMAEHHIAIQKSVDHGRTRVLARELRGEERLDELAAMLGGMSAATRASATELLGRET